MRTKLALLAAVILGFLAAIGVRHYVERKKLELEGGARRAAIAVARETINRGDILREHMIKPVEVEEVAVSAMHVLYDQRRSWIGMPLARKVKAGDPLMKTDFVAPSDVTETASRRIEPGWRAITVGANQISGVAGLITPGARVDILGTFREQGGGPNAAALTVTKVIARNVEVIAVDNRTALSVAARPGFRSPLTDRGYSSITVHVTALEASLLTFAQGSGQLTFALRRTDDVEMKAVPPVTASELDAIIAAAAQERERLLRQRAGKPRGPATP